jgi:hypothetical protein
MKTIGGYPAVGDGAVCVEADQQLPSTPGI